MATAAFVTGQIFPLDGTIKVDFTQVDAVSTSTTGTPGPIFKTGTVIQTNYGPATYLKVGTGGVSAGMYVAVTRATAAGEAVGTKEDTTTSGSAPRVGAVAIATALVDQFAWFLRGPWSLWVPVQVANSVSSGAALTTTATAGELGAGGDTVPGLAVAEASGATGLTGTLASLPLGTNN